MDATVIVINVVGWLGMLLLISAYGLVTAGRITGTSLPFQLMNLFGGAFLMVNSAYYSAWPSAVLNLVWVVIGTVGLLRSRRVQDRGELLDPVDQPGPGAGPGGVGVHGVDGHPGG
ncbi:hypothetical protein [Nocardioides sp. SR21]|uniref:CBU_0592 family membrane protein n=1 Tax=Nocardioides sp. SR21 TaxID=2919501 RepID=UPI001FA9BA8E|nr:hypothetical protein [Nocardioides sp. SR21]